MSKYHRAVSSNTPSRPRNPADEDTAILRKAGTDRQVTKRCFPEATILRYNMLEQTALNVNANGKIMSLGRGPYSKLRGTE